MSTVRRPDHLLTLDEWDALGSDGSLRWAELVKGMLLVAPPPASRHQIASVLLGSQLNTGLMAAGFIAIPDVEVVLRSAPPTVRVPDLSVVSLDDARPQPRGYRGDQVRLAVEIASPGSGRRDTITKLGDYADAGIPHFWIVDLDDGVRLDAFHLVDGRYEPVLEGTTGRVTLDAPVPVDLDLDALVPR